MTMTVGSDLQISPADRADLWQGAIEWEPVGELWQPWRLPSRQLLTAHSPVLTEKARMAAGVRAEMITDAGALALEIVIDHETPSPVDLVVDGGLLAREPLRDGSNDVRLTLPEGTHRVELWLPHLGEIKIGPLTLQGATTAASVDARRHWIAYGSSITHCSASEGPSETWPALVARAADWELTCLGFGGQCHLDPVAARTIAAAPADLISLCLGINIYGGSSFGPRTLASQVSGFIQTIRDAHPETPIVVQSPIASPDREETENAVGMTLAEVRRQVEKSVTLLQDLGDDHLSLINGLEVLSPEDADLLHDGLHPGPDGYRLMAERIGVELRRLSV